MDCTLQELWTLADCFVLDTLRAETAACAVNGSLCCNRRRRVAKIRHRLYNDAFSENAARPRTTFPLYTSSNPYIPVD